jgi:GNAT superfamily N-acetyltransferase
VRPANFLDIPLLMSVYSAWPVTEDNPPVYESDVRDWIHRWKNRDDESCMVMDGIGFVVYRREGSTVKDINIGVHPEQRGKGYANRMVKELRDKLVSEGVAVAEFDAIPGPIADQIERGKYINLGEKDGRTGKLVRGRLTADMEV